MPRPRPGRCGTSWRGAERLPADARAARGSFGFVPTRPRRLRQAFWSAGVGRRLRLTTASAEPPPQARLRPRSHLLRAWGLRRCGSASEPVQQPNGQPSPAPQAQRSDGRRARPRVLDDGHRGARARAWGRPAVVRVTRQNCCARRADAHRSGGPGWSRQMTACAPERWADERVLPLHSGCSRSGPTRCETRPRTTLVVAAPTAHLSPANAGWPVDR